jgi:hypothetical protein
MGTAEDAQRAKLVELDRVTRRLIDEVATLSARVATLERAQETPGNGKDKPR